MDEEDKNDIIKKVNTAGNEDSEGSDFNDGDNNTNNNNANNNGGNNDVTNNDEFGTGDNEEDLEEIEIYENEKLFLDEPVKNNMFQPNSNDILNTSLKENLIVLNNFSIFDKNYLLKKLHESLNQDDMISTEPITAPEPEVKPSPTQPSPIQPSRRNKPFLPMPEVTPLPKATDK